MNIASKIQIVGLFLLTACSSAGETVLPPATSTATAPPQPTAVTTPVPTPSSPGDTIVWRNLQASLDRLEITQEYETAYGSKRIPPPGQKFLWVHVRLRNLGQVEVDLPASEHYSVLYAAAELKPTYGYRAQYPDYTALGPTIFPAQELDGWLRFDIPAAAELRDLRFVFLPESAQVGASFDSPEYPYGRDKPTYVWNCVP